MKNLELSFQKIAQIYRNHKSSMQTYADNLKSGGYTTEYTAYSGRMQKTEVLITQLTAALVHADMQENYGVLKIQIKELKKLVKELIELKKSVWRQWIEAILVMGPLIFVLKTYVFGTYYVPTGSAEPTILVGDRLWVNKLVYHYQDIKQGDYLIFDDPKFVYDKNPIQALWQKYIGVAIPILGLKDGAMPYTKRIIAVPGDYIEGREEDGKAVLYVNDVKINESYLNPYPLIYTRRVSGFIDLGPFANFPIINWLQYKEHQLTAYTFDATKDIEHQPFYHLYPSEIVIHPRTQRPIFRQPYEAESIDIFPRMRLGEGKYWGMGDSRKNSADSRVFGDIDKSLIYGRISFIMWSIDSVESFWPFELLKHPIDFFRYKIRWSRFFNVIKHRYDIKPKV